MRRSVRPRFKGHGGRRIERVQRGDGMVCRGLVGGREHGRRFGGFGGAFFAALAVAVAPTAAAAAPFAIAAFGTGLASGGLGLGAERSLGHSGFNAFNRRRLLAARRGFFRTAFTTVAATATAASAAVALGVGGRRVSGGLAVNKGLRCG